MYEKGYASVCWKVFEAPSKGATSTGCFGRAMSSGGVFLTTSVSRRILSMVCACCACLRGVCGPCATVPPPPLRVLPAAFFLLRGCETNKDRPNKRVILEQRQCFLVDYDEEEQNNVKPSKMVLDDWSMFSNRPSSAAVSCILFFVFSFFRYFTIVFVFRCFVCLAVELAGGRKKGRDLTGTYNTGTYPVLADTIRVLVRTSALFYFTLPGMFTTLRSCACHRRDIIRW